ncbi:MAG: NAD(P)-binding protein [Bryobacterales bacterium]|nr:NAD(P)-binding protein [Bryobacteraceae bacterium]MDW8130765.1 NAD(P)-binding protein [Bryobacterales bacterium]
MQQRSFPVVILGEGPAGLSAAYELARQGVPPLVLEKETTIGGLARTVEYKGFLFDIGGHRFFNNSPKFRPSNGSGASCWARIC